MEGSCFDLSVARILLDVCLGRRRSMVMDYSIFVVLV